MTSTAALEQLVERVGTLPHLPDTLLRLVTVVSDPDCSLDQIVEAIRYDQSLTAEVLRLCNSAYYGLARTIESVDSAICLLGTVRVFQLIMAAHARALFGPAQEGYGLPAGALWLHSVGVAVASQLLARRVQLAQTGLVFTAGLLHDCGKVVLNEFVSREYAEIVQRVSTQRRTFAEAEREVLGFTHAEVGARLAEVWSLPERLVACIRYHHDPENAPATDALVDAVHLADAVCILLGIGMGDEGSSYRVSHAVLARCGLKEADLEGLGAETVGELRSLRTLFAR